MQLGNKKTVIDANSKSLKIDFKELFAYRDLFYSLAYREYRSKYAQTSLGLTWAFIKPISALLIFTLVFGKFANIGVENYPLYACCGLLPWAYFSSVFVGAGNSLINNAAMIRKVYFPRLIVPLSKAVIGFIDFLIVLVLVIFFLIYYDYSFRFELIYLPFYTLLCIVTSLGVGIWLSAITIKFRDLQQIIPFLIQFLLYMTPVAYPTHMVLDKLPEWGVYLYYLNPLAGIIEGFRWSILGEPILSNMFYVSFSMSFLLLISGVIYYKKMEKHFTDIL